MPNSSHFTATSRSIAKPKVTGRPSARTTRMPMAMRPSVLPFVRAIIQGAYSRATTAKAAKASIRPTISDTTPTSSPAKNPAEKIAPNAIISRTPPTPTIRVSISVAPTRGHQPDSRRVPAGSGAADATGPPAPGGGGLV
jgi:hypothetical protein